MLSPKGEPSVYANSIEADAHDSPTEFDINFQFYVLN